MGVHCQPQQRDKRGPVGGGRNAATRARLGLESGGGGGGAAIANNVLYYASNNNFQALNPVTGAPLEQHRHRTDPLADPRGRERGRVHRGQQSRAHRVRAARMPPMNAGSGTPGRRRRRSREPDGSPPLRTGGGTCRQRSRRKRGDAVEHGRADGQRHVARLDMQSASTFDQITMNSGGSTNDYARGYEVHVSSDGVNFGNPVATGTASARSSPCSSRPRPRATLSVV